MTAASVQIDEYNTSSETKEANITNTNMGYSADTSADIPNLTAATYPIPPNYNSFEKWQKLEVTAMGDATKIYQLKVWRTGDAIGSDTHKTNARESSYGGAEGFVTPTTTTSTVATETMPTSEPSGPNLGISGSLSGELTAIGYSDYFVHQIHVDTGTTVGKTCTMNYKYTEVS